MRSLFAQQNKSAERFGQKTSAVKQARTIFSMSLLLGLTWIFGLLTIGKMYKAFQWIFAVLNVLQGFFISFFYAARNPEVKQEITNYLKTRKKNTKAKKSLSKDKKKSKYISIFIEFLKP